MLKRKTKSGNNRRQVGRGLPAPTERRAYRVNEFCEAFRISRQTAYELMKTGKLPYFLIGTERRIPVEAAEALTNQS